MFFSRPSLTALQKEEIENAAITLLEVIANARILPHGRLYESWTELNDQHEIEIQYRLLRSLLYKYLPEDWIPADIARCTTFSKLFCHLFARDAFNVDKDNVFDKLTEVIVSSYILSRRTARAVVEKSVKDIVVKPAGEHVADEVRSKTFKTITKWLIGLAVPAGSVIAFSSYIRSDKPGSQPEDPPPIKVESLFSCKLVPYYSPLNTKRADAQDVVPIEFECSDPAAKIKIQWADRRMEHRGRVETTVATSILCNVKDLPPDVYYFKACIQSKGNTRYKDFFLPIEHRFSANYLVNGTYGDDPQELRSPRRIHMPHVSQAGHPATFALVSITEQAQIRLLTQKGRFLDFTFKGCRLDVGLGNSIKLLMHKPIILGDHGGDSVVIFVAEETEGQVIGGIIDDHHIVLACRTYANAPCDPSGRLLEMKSGMVVLDTVSLSSNPSQTYKPSTKWGHVVSD